MNQSHPHLLKRLQWLPAVPKIKSTSSMWLLGPPASPTHPANLNLAPGSPQSPGPSHTGFLDVFKHVRLLPAPGPYTFSLFSGPPPASARLTASHPLDLSSGSQAQGLREAFPDHLIQSDPISFLLLVNTPMVSLLCNKRPYSEVILFVSSFTITILLLNIKLLRAEAGFFLLHQGHIPGSQIF